MEEKRIRSPGLVTRLLRPVATLVPLRLGQSPYGTLAGLTDGLRPAPRLVLSGEWTSFLCPSLTILLVLLRLLGSLVVHPDDYSRYK